MYCTLYVTLQNIWPEKYNEAEWIWQHLASHFIIIRKKFRVDFFPAPPTPRFRSIYFRILNSFLHLRLVDIQGGEFDGGERGGGRGRDK
jgi:hypothetical protein